ncbi:hypothetical protein [Streptomyces sp. NPDC051567]|uniref:hypothetical protein n=1 Tax=Streptomyces sp. NPDC051567 TaxID=3365660 RepID=UPI0037A14E58
MTPQPSGPFPTRSADTVEWDEGPQSIAELKSALAPWPDLLKEFITALEAAPFHSEGDEPLRKVRGVISAYRVEWMAKVHPEILQAVADSEDGLDDGVPLDVVMADYDPVTFEHRDGGDRA